MGIVNEELIDTPWGIQQYLMGSFRSPGVSVMRDSRTGDMEMAVLQEGRVRGGSNDGENRSMAVTPTREALVAQGLPPYTELVRQGMGWSVMATAAVAALVVRPSTVAAITLWNGETTGGKSYVIDRLFTHNLVSTAADAFFGIWACIHPAGMTEPTADIAPSATNFTGSSGKTYSGMGVVDVGATVVDNGWYPWSNAIQIEGTGILPGSTASVDVAGRLIVPPQGAISVQVVAAVVGNTFCSGLSWYEIALDLE